LLQVGLRGVLFEFKGEQLQGSGRQPMLCGTKTTLHFSTLNKEEWIPQ